MTQEGAHLCIEAMQKEVAYYELRNHWTIVHRSTVPKTAKPIQPIWSFKRKQCPDGTHVKNKASWRNATKGHKLLGTYAPVVNMVTVCLILLLARIYKLESKAIDFVLAFPQAELDVNIWMYPPISFQVDTENESKCYILKLNKSVHGLINKQV
jgi:hypothetical protein